MASPTKRRRRRDEKSPVLQEHEAAHPYAHPNTEADNHSELRLQHAGA